MTALALTDVQQRILEDFADPDLSTRHSRSSQEEWRDNRATLLHCGLLGAGLAREGEAHYITAPGLASLEAAGSPVIEARRLAAERPKRVHVPIGSVEHSWTVEEATTVIARISKAIDALRVKCPTCRCRILPGQICGCCAEPPGHEPLI